MIKERSESETDRRRNTFNTSTPTHLDTHARKATLLGVPLFYVKVSYIIMNVISHHNLKTKMLDCVASNVFKLRPLTLRRGLGLVTYFSRVHAPQPGLCSIQF